MANQLKKNDGIEAAKQKRLLQPHVPMGETKPIGLSLITSFFNVSDYTPEKSSSLLERYHNRFAIRRDSKGLYVGFYLSDNKSVSVVSYVEEANGTLCIVPGVAATVGIEIETLDIPFNNLCLAGLSVEGKRKFWQDLCEAAPTAEECKAIEMQVADAIAQEALIVTTLNISAFDALVTAAQFDKELAEKVMALENAKNIEILQATNDPNILAMIENAESFCENLENTEGIASLLSNRGSKGLLTTLALLQGLGFGQRKTEAV